MARIKNKNIVEIGNVSPIICRNINVYSVYPLQSILFKICRLFWLPPLFILISSKNVRVSIFQLIYLNKYVEEKSFRLSSPHQVTLTKLIHKATQRNKSKVLRILSKYNFLTTIFILHTVNQRYDSLFFGHW